MQGILRGGKGILNVPQCVNTIPRGYKPSVWLFPVKDIPLQPLSVKPGRKSR